MGKLIEISATHSVAAETIAELYVIPGEAVVVGLKNGSTLFADVKEDEPLCRAYHRILVEIQIALCPMGYIVSSQMQLEADPRLYEALRWNHEELRVIADHSLLK
ncbi:hypothetical protein [Klebsiella michiganensis]|uniref:hypothetical protein n=1 Tax=Klebsiella michiganensis TaxID=1134687 RepID=UPI00255AA2FC|nr:hypothetical protein [Klebsiella michiganensis]MDL4445111.1 hypothetical protein [Klebsiella michiganensis]MDL4485997.1 hypothetical protein [Klebsiella michiganensis]MDL4660836.1 hypothetical protein [Klebsiella michiganensis]